MWNISGNNLVTHVFIEAVIVCIYACECVNNVKVVLQKLLSTSAFVAVFMQPLSKNINFHKSFIYMTCMVGLMVWCSFHDQEVLYSLETRLTTNSVGS